MNPTPGVARVRRATRGLTLHFWELTHGDSVAGWARQSRPGDRSSWSSGPMAGLVRAGRRTGVLVDGWARQSRPGDQNSFTFDLFHILTSRVLLFTFDNVQVFLLQRIALHHPPSCLQSPDSRESTGDISKTQKKQGHLSDSNANRNCSRRN